MDRAVIDRYVEGGRQLRQAVEGLTEKELLARPAEGGWSIQQIVLHLMDADLIWTARLKQMIAEENPRIVGYDESKFASGLFYQEQSIEDALSLFEVNRRQFARVLRQVPDAAMSRKGQHSERGEIRLGECIEMCIEHVEHHLRFLHQKRRRLGR